MTGTDLDPGELEILHDAAGRLAAVGRDIRTAPAMATRCLQALEHLHVAGAAAVPVAAGPAGDAASEIRAALSALAGLPEVLFSSVPVLDAVACAQAALVASLDG